MSRVRRLRSLTLLAAAALAVPIAPALSAEISAPAVQTTTDREVPAMFGDFYPAALAQQIIKQPDGTEFRAQLTNAEIGGAFESGGYTIVQGKDEVWRYATGRNAEGELIASDAVVGVDPVPAGIAQGVGRTDNVWLDEEGHDHRSEVLRQLQIASYKAQMTAAAAGEPRVFKFPVLMLATWWDPDKGQTGPSFQEGTDTPEYFKKLLDGFGGNPNGTITEFYFEDSFGQFLVQVDVHGPYVSERSRADRCYYGGIEPGDDGQTDLDLIDDVLGIGGGGALGMAGEAVPKADPTVDFSQYDNDGDSVVDFVGIVHSGPGMEVTGDPCHTWSHAIEATLGATPGQPDGIPTNDQVFVDRLFTMPEFNDFGQPLTIGVAAHEMAHALGEPDYYNTTYTSMGTGDWDIMSGGSYLGNPAGSNPSGFNPASRVFQGWVQPTIVDTDRRGYRLDPRRIAPAGGYTVAEPNPRLVLVPLKEIAVGETDQYEHEWTETDVYGLPKNPKTGKFVIEGYYLENMSRTANGAPLHEKMTRSPYFDRQLLGSGVMTWHFDYHQRSNVYYGSNNAQNDANRPQMDVMEWDFNDNTQEQQLSLSRGNPEDVMFGAATGITSGTRKLPPGIPVTDREPQADSEFSGVAPPQGNSDTEFTVEDNPANYKLTVRIQGTGDCTLQILKDGKSIAGTSDGSLPTDAEELSVVQPAPGVYVARVGDFAACGPYDGTITYESATEVLVTKGAADTWSNWSAKASGWAFTNVGPAQHHGLDHSADGGGTESITLDIVNLGDTELDASPGFVSGQLNNVEGTGGLTAGQANSLSVPVFNNGGKAIPSVGVQVRRGSATGPVVASTTVTSIGAYTRKDVSFSYTPTGEGWQELFVTVDPTGGLAEAHEGNNTQRSSLWAGPANPTVLIVDDDGALQGEKAFAGALASLGVPYSIVKDHPTAAQLAGVKAVLWETGGERYQGQLDGNDRAALRSYLDNGGRVLVTGPRIIDALGEDPGRTNPGGSAEGQAFLKQYFGADYFDSASPNDLDTKIKGTGGVFGASDFTVSQLPGRHIINRMKVADYTKPVSDEKTYPAIGTVAPALIEVTANPEQPKDEFLGLSVTGDAAHKNFKTIVTGFNIMQLSSADQYAAFTKSALDFFGVPTGSYTVSSSTPVIYDPPVRNRRSFTKVDVRAFILGSGTGTPTLFYRRHGKGDYYSTPMTRGASRGAFHGVIPPEAVTPDGVDYYIQAGSAFSPPLASNRSVVHAIGVSLPEVEAPIPVKGGTAPVGDPNLTLTANTLQITAGNSPLLSGVAKSTSGQPLADTTVTVVGKKWGVGQSYQNVASVKTDATGKWSLLLKDRLSPITQTAYIAKVGTRQTSAVTIRVYARINITSATSSGGVVTFRGNMVPPYPNAPVGLAHFDANRKFTYLAQARNDGNGNWVISKALAPGTYNFVVYTSARHGTDKGSKSLRLTVR